MPVLQNTRQELFCQNLFAGMTQTEAAIKAGYAPVAARSQGSSLLTKPNIKARMEELKEGSANVAVMSVAERKAKLSDIARSEWSNKDGITPVPNISAINVLNKMDNIYKADFVTQDNRQLIINVLDKRTRDDIKGIIEGQYKELPPGDNDVTQANQS